MPSHGAFASSWANGQKHTIHTLKINAPPSGNHSRRKQRRCQESTTKSDLSGTQLLSRRLGVLSKAGGAGVRKQLHRELSGLFHTPQTQPTVLKPGSNTCKSRHAQVMTTMGTRATTPRGNHAMPIHYRHTHGGSIPSPFQVTKPKRPPTEHHADAAFKISNRSINGYDRAVA